MPYAQSAGDRGDGWPGRDGAGLGCPLYGREQELGLLDGLLVGAAERGEAQRGGARRGAALLVKGPAGIGKSALMGAARTAALARGMQVLTMTGVQSEAHLPFAGLHQLVRPVLPRAATLPGPQRDAIRAAFGMSPAAGLNFFFVALAALNLLTEAAADAPVLLIAEDIQWLDRPSRDVLGFVARRLSSDPIVLLAAGRTDADRPLRGMGLPELVLEPLGEAASGVLLDAASPSLTSADRERILQVAAGNPLALMELPLALRAGQADPWTLVPAVLPLTARLEHAFATRTLGLPTATRIVLLVAAVDDSTDLAEILAAATVAAGVGVSEDDLAVALQAGLIELDQPSLRFRHPLVRSAIYHEAALPQRRAAHAALASLLAGQPDRRTWHLAASLTGPDEAVATELEHAGMRARERGAIAAALAAHERAAMLTGDPALRGSLLLQAAEMAGDLGRLDIAARLVREARPLTLRGREQIRLAWLEHTVSPGKPADEGRLRALLGLADQARQEQDPDLALSILSGAAFTCFWAGHGEQLRRLTVAAAQRVPVPGDDPRLLAALALADPVGHGAAVIDGVARLELRPDTDAGLLHLAGIAATIVGDFSSGAAYLAAAAARLRAQGRLALLGQALVAQAWTAIQLVDWDTAIPAAEEGRRLAGETEQPLFVATGETAAALLAALRGDEETAGSLNAKVEREVAPSTGPGRSSPTAPGFAASAASPIPGLRCGPPATGSTRWACSPGASAPGMNSAPRARPACSTSPGHGAGCPRRNSRSPRWPPAA